MAALQAQLQQKLENQGLLDEAQIELLSPGQQTLYREAEEQFRRELAALHANRPLLGNIALSGANGALGGENARPSHD